jgi:diguanylate cyclase (GGDEF)-like protein/PAS domain S-box-containing protein
MRILVVEDNEVSARFLQRTLQKMDYEVTVVGDGEAAWDLLQKEDFSIVISDWMMPRMDGLELCRQVRSRQGHPYAYIILLTAKDLREDRLEGLRSGADDFLVKPMDPAELRARLEVARRILAMQAKLADTIRYLEVANYLYSELYMGLPIACITYGPDGAIHEWNRACESVFGLAADEGFRKMFWETISGTTGEAPHVAAVRHALVGASIENVEWTYAHPDGQPRHLLCNAFPMLGPGGTIMGAISTHVDITRRKEYERQIGNYSAELERQKDQLEEANTRLEALATTDGLTGLKNHRAFQERLAHEFQRGARYYTPLSLLMFDVDHFKLFNDAHGHPAGDQVLRKVATVLRKNVRATDFVARYGGEEFVVLLPHTPAAGAMGFAERLRAAIERGPWDLQPFTVSGGVASLERATDDALALIEEADKALYASKALGRNRVTRYGA